MSAGGIVPILAAAAAKRRQEEEEEKMSIYTGQDLNTWEFKIVRSVFGSGEIRQLPSSLQASGRATFQ